MSGTPKNQALLTELRFRHIWYGGVHGAAAEEEYLSAIWTFGIHAAFGPGIGIKMPPGQCGRRGFWAVTDKQIMGLRPMKMTTEEAFVKVLQMHGIEHAFGIIDQP